MPKRNKSRQSLEDILKSISDSLHMIEFEDRPISVNSVASDGETPLHIAALRGDRYAVEILLEAGAEIDTIGDLGCTPLYNAVMGKHISVVKLLLKNGANPDINTELGYTPRTLAALNNDGEMNQLFRRKKA